MRGEDRVNSVLLLAAQEDVQTVAGPRACDGEGLQGAWPTAWALPPPSVPGPLCPPVMSLGFQIPSLGVRPWLCHSLRGLWVMSTVSEPLSAHLESGHKEPRFIRLRGGPSAAQQQEVLGKLLQCGR